MGGNVIIEQSFGGPKVPKDGVTVASLVKQVANSTNDVAGDGTTCATVLTQAILIEGVRSVGVGLNAMDLRRGMTMAVDIYKNLGARRGMRMACFCTTSTPEYNRDFEFFLRSVIKNEVKLVLEEDLLAPSSDGCFVLHVDGAFHGSHNLLQLAAVCRSVDTGRALFASHCNVDINDFFPGNILPTEFKILRDRKDSTITELLAKAFGMILVIEYGVRECVVFTDSDIGHRMLCLKKHKFKRDSQLFIAISLQCLWSTSKSTQFKKVVRIDREFNQVANDLSQLGKTTRYATAANVTYSTILEGIRAEIPGFRSRVEQSVKVSGLDVEMHQDYNKLLDKCRITLDTLLHGNK